MTSPTVITEPSAPRVVPPRRLSWKRLGGKFLVFSVLAHVLFLSVATYFVVQTYSAKHKQTFTPMAKGPSASTRALEHKVQQKHQQAASAPPSARRVTSTSPNAKISLPAMPAMPSMTASLSPATISGMGSGGVAPGGLAGGAGGGTGGNGGGVNFFGVSSGGRGLTGTFYDLKQTQSRQPTGMTPAKFEQIMKSFAAGGFNTGVVASYYKASKPLVTSQLFTPEMNANAGPAAFQVDKEVQPKMWMIHYKGNVSPPEDGTYNFVGFGDDYLLVKFDGKLVLDGSVIGKVTPLASRPKYSYKYGRKDGVSRGESFTVRAGESYPIEIVIGEQPGGWMMADLLIEKEGVTYPKDDKGNPILPIFRLANSAPVPKGKFVPHQDTGPIWKTAAPKTGSSIFDR